MNRGSVAAAAVVAALGSAGVAGAADRWVVSSTSQIKPSVLRHLRGRQGPPGLPGPAGVVERSSVYSVLGPEVQMTRSATDPDGAEAASVVCRGADAPIGGGGETSDGAALTGSSPSVVGDEFWRASAVLLPGSQTGWVRAWVLCSGFGYQGN